MLKKLLGLGTALALLPSASATAQDAAAIAASSFYTVLLATACAMFVAGEDEPGDEEEGSSADYGRRGPSLAGAGAYALPGDAAGFRLSGGYRCHKNVAADLEFEWLDDLHSDSSKSTHYWKIGLNTKVFISSGRTQPFFLLGFGILGADRKNSSEVNSDFLVNFGSGIDWYYTEKIALTLDAKFTIPSGGARGLWNVSTGGGVKYRF